MTDLGSTRISTINRNSPVPLYHQLKEILIVDLENGHYPVGSILAGEMELVEQYHLSRATVRRAMQELEYEGYLQRTPGRGTTVIREKGKLNRGLTTLTSFTEDMRARGYDVTTRILRMEYMFPSLEVATLLHSEDQPVIYIARIRYVNDLPVAINISYLHLPDDKTISEEELVRSGSLYNLLENKNIQLLEADKTIDAIAADHDMAKLLNVHVGTPLLQVKGVVSTLNQVPIEYLIVISRSDMYQYSLHLVR